MLKALILDLDDTIFPTNSIDPLIVKPFFDALEANNDVLSADKIEEAKGALWQRPFHVVAASYGFSQSMITKSLEALNQLHFDFDICTYQDYEHLKKLKLPKFLVTTGITKLQLAKIDSLGLQNDFEEIIIDDPTLTSGGKVAAFRTIMQKYQYQANELLVIGDNPESEIKAGRELGIPTLLIARKEMAQKQENTIKSFEEVLYLLKA